MTESVYLEAPEGCVVWEGTFKSSRFPSFVKGRIQAFAKGPEETEEYQTHGCLTFEGCVKRGCVYPVCVNMSPGSDPLTTGSAKAECSVLNMELELTEYNEEVTDVKGTYNTTTKPLDDGTLWMHKTDRTTIDFTPKSSFFTIFGF